MESFEDTREERLLDDLTKKAVMAVFNRYYQLPRLEEVITQFNSGFSVEVSDTMPAKSYVRNVKEIMGLAKVVKSVDDSERPETIASAVEFVLEGLHLNKRLNKSKLEGKTVYRR
jgi:magnesium chelatase subunit I